MKAGIVIQNRSIRWFLVVAVWTLIGLSFAHQFYVSSATFGNPITWRHAMVHSLADWYLFALLSIPAVALARRFAIEQMNWLRRACLHLVAGVVFSVTWMAFRAAVGLWQGSASAATISFLDLFRSLFVKTFYFNLFVYWAITSVTHAFNYYQRFHDREFNALELEKRLTQAKLQALQMQLNPHFLFNTLHTISALVHKDAEAADRMISRLSLLLRYTLESTAAHEVPLKQELAFLDRYLEIEQTRFGNRLTVLREIAPEALEAQVPNLLLQPLVENAIRHGIEPQTKLGRIELRAQRMNEHLQIEVRDNGAGLPGGELTAEGIGLSNTRERLRQLYGEDQNIDLSNSAGGGLRVAVTIPFRVASNGQSDSAHAKWS
ncbi:MAG: histidine kinase [Verrucomicrobia bacterium]|nr:histidine kinase [Verrucomicrobiota bacterium]